MNFTTEQLKAMQHYATAQECHDAQDNQQLRYKTESFPNWDGTLSYIIIGIRNNVPVSMEFVECSGDYDN